MNSFRNKKTHFSENVSFSDILNDKLTVSGNMIDTNFKFQQAWDLSSEF